MDRADRSYCLLILLLAALTDFGVAGSVGSSCFIRNTQDLTVTGSGHCYNNDAQSIQHCRTMGFSPSEDATICSSCQPDKEFCCSYPGLMLPGGPPSSCPSPSFSTSTMLSSGNISFELFEVSSTPNSHTIEANTSEYTTRLPDGDLQTTTEDEGYPDFNIWNDIIYNKDGPKNQNHSSTDIDPSTSGGLMDLSTMENNMNASFTDEANSTAAIIDSSTAYCNRPSSQTPKTKVRDCYIASLYESQTSSIPFGLKTVGVGILVDPQWILTTAVRFPTSFEIGRFWVKLGPVPQSIPYKVVSIIPQTSIRHPENGLSLLKLEQLVSNHCTACLTDPLTDHDVMHDGYQGDCVAMGFNATSAFGKELNDGQVQRVQYDILGREVCEEARKKSSRKQWYGNEITLRQEGMVAAGWFCGGKPGQKGCMKDYGAPLMCIDKSKGFQRVAGLMVSTGCLDDEMRGVGAFIEVGSVLDWIQYVTGRPLRPRKTS